jgi:hypothetical protein
MTINVLHLVIASGAIGAVAFIHREGNGHSLPFARLFAAPLLASAVAFLLLAVAAPDARKPALWLAALAVGIAAGTARGIVLPFQVDRLWDRLRLPRSRDGLWVAGLFGAATLLALGTDALPDDFEWADLLDIVTSSAAAGCAGFLAGRACLLWLRSIKTRHQA